MNPGSHSFPRRNSAITSPEDKYAPFDGGGYLTAGESIMKGDLFCAHGSESGFPIERGALPAGGVADAVLSAGAAVTSSVSDIDSVSSVGLEAGKAMIAYGRSAYNNSAAATVFTTSVLSYVEAALLTNGSYAIVSDGVSNYPYLTILNSSGTITYGPTSTESVAIQGDIGVAGLTSGNLVVAWGVTNAVKFRTYTAAGAAVSAITTVEAVSASTGILGVCALTGGGFVVAYKSNTTTYPRYAIFDNAGASVLAATSIEAAAMGSYISIAALSGGGFVIGYTNASGHPKFAIYNAAGTLQGSITTVVATSSQGVDVAGMNDGGFVLVHTNSSTDLRTVAYTSGGVVRIAARALVTVNTAAIQSVATLPNGDVVVAYRDSGGYVSYIKLSHSLNIIEAAIRCDSTYTTSDVAVCPLADNRFVIANMNGTTVIYQYLNTFVGSTSYARYESDGVINGVVTSVVANPTKAISSAKVGGGGFVIGYQSLSNTPSLALFDQDAVLVGSITVPEVVYTQAVAVAALETGGYVAAWSDEFNSRIRFARYSSAGVLQGAITTGEAVITTFISIAPLRNGGFALLYLNPTNNYPRIAIYDATGTQVFAPANIEAVAATFVASDGLTDGNLVVFYNNAATNLRFTVIDSEGFSVIAPTLIETAAVTGAGGVHGAPGGEFIVAYGIAAGTLIKTRRYSKYGVQQNTTITVVTKATLAVDVSALNNGDYWPVYGNATDSSIDFARYNSPVVVLGAAKKAGGRGAIIPVQTEGLAVLREDWGGVKTFDNSTATTVAGNEGSVFGRAANLLGI